MSVYVMSLVWQRFPSGGGDMLLALALADHASDDGTKIYPSVGHLAKKTRQSERTVQYQLRRMEEMGWIILVNAGNGGRNFTREYHVNPDWIRGADIAPLGKTPPKVPKNEGGANSAPLQKGATDDGKGATDDIKGATDGGKGATAIAPANNHQEPSGTTIETKPAAPAVPPAPPAPPKEPAKKAKASPATPGVVLPDWLPESAWEMWVRHRAKDKKTALDDDSAALCLKRLAKLRAEGSDPVAVIENSVTNGWRGLFPAQDEQPRPTAPARPARGPKFDPSDYVNSGAAYGTPAAAAPASPAANNNIIDAEFVERAA